MTIAFVIPVVHPKGERVSDYRTVETVLRVTLESLCNQHEDDIAIIVVVHQIPHWHRELLPKVRFLQLVDDAAFPMPWLLRHIDKGLKHALGSWFAIDHLAARHIVIMDGDDFARRDLAGLVRASKLGPPGRDGWMITAGFHADLSVGSDGLRVHGVYEVSEFNKTCGSCRIFLPDAIVRFIEDNTPEFRSVIRFLDHGQVFFVPRDGLAALLHDIEPAFRAHSHPIRYLGNHTHQDRRFGFANLDIPLMAKGCGHGNHAGPRAGAVHWHRVRRRLDRREFVEKFGLSGVENVEIAGGGLSAIEVQSRVLTATARLAGQKIRKKLGG